MNECMQAFGVSTEQSENKTKWRKWKKKKETKKCVKLRDSRTNKKQTVENRKRIIGIYFCFALFVLRFTDDFTYAVDLVCFLYKLTQISCLHSFDLNKLSWLKWNKQISGENDSKQERYN